MRTAFNHWFAVFRAEGLDPIRACLLALLKVAAGDKR